jgi:transposase
MSSTFGRGDRPASMSATVTLSPVVGRPGLYFDLLDHNVHGEDVVRFLAELHRRLGPLTVVWDRNPIHGRSRAVREWLARHPGVVCEDFPGYVPDLNPDEGVWGWAKYGRLPHPVRTGHHCPHRRATERRCPFGQLPCCASLPSRCLNSQCGMSNDAGYESCRHARSARG